jgi:hypothetical protein
MENQRQSEQALSAASDAQRRALDEQRKADQEQVKVDKLKQELAQAESSAARQRTAAGQAQQQALIQNRIAAEQSQAAQRAALLSQHRQEQAAARGVSMAQGSVTKAGPRELDIRRADNGSDLHLIVTGNTSVLLNGEPSSVTAVRPGTNVRVSFRPGAGLPEAVRIDAGAVRPQGESPEGP